MRRVLKRFKSTLLPLAVLVFSSCSNILNIKTGEMTLSIDKVEGAVFLYKSGEPEAIGVSKSGLAEINISNASPVFIYLGTKVRSVQNELGAGKVYTIKSGTSDKKLIKEVSISVYKDFPATVFVEASFTNTGGVDYVVEGWKLNPIEIPSRGDEPPFWSFQGESTKARDNWLKPVNPGFFQRNYMGMNDEDYGGGIPVTCIWRKDAGLAIGHVQANPELVSLPVVMEEKGDRACVCIEKIFGSPLSLGSGKSVRTLPSFINLSQGDCFKPLRNYSMIMEKKGLVTRKSPDSAFESSWCAWGYGRKFTIDEVLGTLPKVKELGIKWATIDDGYQIAEGDWDLNEERFPGKDADMKRMIDSIHTCGLKAELWWSPMISDPGTRFLQEHPDALILSKEGRPYNISWWDSYYLSPIDPDVRKETERLVDKFIGTYGFDGLKLDGQYMNAVPDDYNPAHTPEDPSKGYRELPSFFELIINTALKHNPEAVIQNCPCGDNFSFYNLPYTNKTGASDPHNSYQVRTKGYVLRAVAPYTAYYGDHIELSDNASDFPSQLGTGAVLGTKFTWPADNPYLNEKNLLTPEREKIWKHAFSIYNAKMLSKGEYVPGLYDICYDKPETHLIAKDGKLYYAFYTDVPVTSVKLRGLEPGKEYSVTDYYNQIDLGTVKGSDSVTLNTSFEKYLLIEVSPKSI